MLPMTREWVAKAESDYDGACEALRSRKKSRREDLLLLATVRREIPQGASNRNGSGVSSHARVVDPIAAMLANRTAVGRV